MLLLMGDFDNKTFNDRFKSYALNAKNEEKHEWLIAASPEWNNVLTDLFGDSLIKAPENSGKSKWNNWIKRTYEFQFQRSEICSIWKKNNPRNTIWL